MHLSTQSNYKSTYRQTVSTGPCILVLCPRSSFLISVKQEQEAQLAEKRMLSKKQNKKIKKTRLTVCKLYVYAVFGSLLQLPTLV